MGLNKMAQNNKGPEKLPSMNFIGSYITTVNKPASTSTNIKASSTVTKPKGYRTCAFCSEQHESKD